MYEYNRGYGGNDDSNYFKINHRLAIYKHLRALKMLTKIDTLDGSVRDPEVWRELKSDENIRYREEKI